MGKNFFQVLGVTPSSEPAEIAEAFRNLSRKNHPDAGGDPATYVEITEAYSTLKDLKKKRDYVRWLELTQKVCENCKGLGVEWKQQGFYRGSSHVCSCCGGGGYHDNE